MTPPLATSTFLQVMFALLVAMPIIILWVAAVVDVVRHGRSGLKIAGVLVMILILPILGPILYFIFRPETATAAELEAQVMAQADLRREAARAPVGSSGVH